MLNKQSILQALGFFGTGDRIMIQVDTENDLKEARKVVRETVKLAEIHDFYNMIIYENSSIINFEVIEGKDQNLVGIGIDYPMFYVGSAA
jgi:hypothetical protein